MRKFIARVTFDLHGMIVDVSSEGSAVPYYGYFAMVLERSGLVPA